MTNEIRADAIKILVFEKLCSQNNNCKTKKIKSKLESEIKLAILKKAALFERDDFKKYKETEGKKRGVGLIKKRQFLRKWKDIILRQLKKNGKSFGIKTKLLNPE